MSLVAGGTFRALGQQKWEAVFQCIGAFGLFALHTQNTKTQSNASLLGILFAPQPGYYLFGLPFAIVMPFFVFYDDEDAVFFLRWSVALASAVNLALQLCFLATFDWERAVVQAEGRLLCLLKTPPINQR
jgi:hypothetical protein